LVRLLLRDRRYQRRTAKETMSQAVRNEITREEEKVRQRAEMFKQKLKEAECKDNHPYA